MRLGNWHLVWWWWWWVDEDTLIAAKIIRKIWSHVVHFLAFRCPTLPASFFSPHFLPLIFRAPPCTTHMRSKSLCRLTYSLCAVCIDDWQRVQACCEIDLRTPKGIGRQSSPTRIDGVSHLPSTWTPTVRLGRIAKQIGSVGSANDKLLPHETTYPMQPRLQSQVATNCRNHAAVVLIYLGELRKKTDFSTALNSNFDYQLFSQTVTSHRLFQNSNVCHFTRPIYSDGH